MSSRSFFVSTFVLAFLLAWFVGIVSFQNVMKEILHFSSYMSSHERRNKCDAPKLENMSCLVACKFGLIISLKTIFALFV